MLSFLKIDDTVLSNCSPVGLSSSIGVLVFVFCKMHHFWMECKTDRQIESRDVIRLNYFSQ